MTETTKTEYDNLKAEYAKSLTKKEIDAMKDFKKTIAQGFCMGTRRIVSMQKLWRAGLVMPIYVNGLIVDWRITKAGERWNNQERP